MSRARSSPVGITLVSSALPSASSIVASSSATIEACSGFDATSSLTLVRASSAALRSAGASSESPAIAREPLDERDGGLRVRQRRHVVRDPRPQRDRVDVGVRERELERRDDAGGHLELAGDEAHLLQEVLARLGDGRGEAHRPGVRRGRGERAEPDDHADVEPLGEPDDELGELDPVEVGLGPDEQEDVEARRVDAASQLDLGPAQLGR